jgi:hypothetical protein
MKLHTFIGLAGLMVLVVAGCKKEGITTKPKLIFKSVTTEHLQFNQDISFTFEFSDKEGDFNDSIRVVKVAFTACPDESFADSVKWKMPDLSGRKNVQGELEIKMSYQQDLGLLPCGLDTVQTAIFKFVIKDLAGNVSDTAFSPLITIEKN